MSSKDLATKTLRSQQQGEPSPLTVEAVEGPGKGPKLTFERGTLTVGSDAKNDLVLKDPAASRRHATVEHLGHELAVHDLGSRNGTRYLGAKISTARIPFGASILIGKTVVRFRPVKAGIAPSVRDELGGLVGRSDAMKRVFSFIERVAPSESTVLLTGETGVGKGAIAKVIHDLSPRAAGPFVVFDCAGVNANLVEAALFGHVKGAFTGATTASAGALVEAAGGTLFLDEVGELALETQPKLNRVLESRQAQPVGSSRSVPVDVRVVAATHRDLREGSTAGTFRSDLYYRLAVAEFEVPPLRKRPEDIPLLASRFSAEFAGFEVAIAPATLAAFQCAQWPGNVRELRNAVQSAIAFEAGEADGPGSSDESSFIEARDDAMHRFERDYLRMLLQRHRGNASAAARTAKLARSHFYRLLTRHGLVKKGET